jgi:hypothetical protein
VSPTPRLHAIAGAKMDADQTAWAALTSSSLESGHRWAFDQRLREVSVEEIEAQLAGMFGGAWPAARSGRM